MSVRVINPFPFFFDKANNPLDGGKAYFGADGDDPEDTPATVWLDQALTLVAPQPVSVIGGRLTYDGNPCQIFATGPSYSIRARDEDGAEVFYEPSAVIENSSWQPLDSDLTAIAALTTTAWGRALLALADGPALKTYAGIVDPTNPTESLVVAVSDETTALTTGSAKLTFRMPYALTLSSVKASLTTAQATGSIFTVDIKEAGVTILTTKITIDNTEKTSATAAAPPVISDVNLAADAEITIDIVQVGDGTAKGLKVCLIGKQP